MNDIVQISCQIRSVGASRVLEIESSFSSPLWLPYEQLWGQWKGSVGGGGFHDGDGATVAGCTWTSNDVQAP